MPLNAKGQPCGRGSPGVKVAGRKFTIYREPERLTEIEMEQVYDTAKLVWAIEGLTGGTECFYALVRVIENKLLEKWQLRFAS